MRYFYVMAASILIFFSVYDNLYGTEEKGGDKMVSIKIESGNFKNLYKVSDDLYRSEQPDTKGFAELEKLGVKSILNLREYHSDVSKAKNTALVLYRKRLAAGELTQNEIAECLKIIKDAPKPILVHCLHGSDRTGAIVAAYRMVVENRSKEDAVKELLDDRFGHHERYYKNIRILLENLDIEYLKKEIKSSEEKKSSSSKDDDKTTEKSKDSSPSPSSTATDGEEGKS